MKEPNGNREVRRERLEAEKRWSHLTRAGKDGPEGYIELGELCRVHRGQVTGLNKVWIAGAHSQGLPESVLFPTVTKARELFRAGNALEDASILRRVIDIPVDLDVFDSSDRKAVDRFLVKAQIAWGRHRIRCHESKGLVVCRLASGGPDPDDLHGAPAAGLRSQSRPGAAPEYRPRHLPARIVRADGPRQPGRLLAQERKSDARTNVCGGVDEIRAEGS